MGRYLSHAGLIYQMIQMATSCGDVSHATTCGPAYRPYVEQLVPHRFGAQTPVQVSATAKYIRCPLLAPIAGSIKPALEGRSWNVGNGRRADISTRFLRELSGVSGIVQLE